MIKLFLAFLAGNTENLIVDFVEIRGDFLYIRQMGSNLMERWIRTTELIGFSTSTPTFGKIDYEAARENAQEVWFGDPVVEPTRVKPVVPDKHEGLNMDYSDE